MQSNQIFTNVLRFLNKINIKIFSDSIFINKEVSQIIDLLFQVMDRLGLIHMSKFYQKMKNFPKKISLCKKYVIVRDIYQNVLGVEFGHNHVQNFSDEQIQNLFQVLSDFDQQCSDVRGYLQNQLNQEKDQDNKKNILKKEIQIKKSELDEIKERKEEQKPMAETLKKETQQIKDQIGKRNINIKMNNQILSDKQQQNKQLSEEVSKREREIKELKEKEQFKSNQIVENYSEILKEKRNLEENIKKIKEEIEEIGKKMELVEDEHQRLREIQEQQKELRRLMDTLNKKSEIQKGMRERLDYMEKEIKVNKDQVKENTYNYDQNFIVKAQYEKDCKFLEQDWREYIRNKEIELQSLQQKIEEQVQEEKRVKNKNEELENEISQLEKEIQSQIIERQEIQEEFQKFESIVVDSMNKYCSNLQLIYIFKILMYSQTILAIVFIFSNFTANNFSHGKSLSQSLALSMTFSSVKSYFKQRRLIKRDTAANSLGGQQMHKQVLKISLRKY